MNFMEVEKNINFNNKMDVEHLFQHLTIQDNLIFPMDDLEHSIEKMDDDVNDDVNEKANENTNKNVMIKFYPLNFEESTHNDIINYNYRSYVKISQTVADTVRLGEFIESNGRYRTFNDDE